MIDSLEMFLDLVCGIMLILAIPLTQPTYSLAVILYFGMGYGGVSLLFRFYHKLKNK